MQISRILYPISTLGPGERLVIWTIGCSKKCYKCANPELWKEDISKDINPGELANNIREALNGKKVDGVTITGGDPLEQSSDLITLIKELKSITDDVLVFTGFTLEEVKKELSKIEYEELIENVSVFITGSYIDKLNDNKCPLRGSSNQEIIFFDEKKVKLYKTYLHKKRTIQNVYVDERLFSVGIHNKEY